MDQQSFLFQATVYLAASVIMVPIAKKLSLGSVLGYLLAGIIIGPFVLGFIGEEGEDLMHFAEFGVVMMLFIIGLELEPELLWKMRKSILGLGAMQVVITTLVIAAAALAFGLAWNIALAAGLLLSLSSTAIVLQTLGEKGLMNTAAGQSSFAVLLFQDIAVIPMLAIFPLLSLGAKKEETVLADAHAQGTLLDHLPGWAQPLAVLGAVAAVIALGRFVVIPLLRIIAKTRLREMFTAASLLVVVSIAALMISIGLSPALGTFLAGVVLANSEFKHELESDIEPFKGLLLGLFFIAVGASIDFALILAQPLVIIGLVLVLMVAKALIIWILGSVAKMGFDQNAIFSLSLSQAGEFGFVLVSFALSEAIFDQQTAGIINAVIAISMAFTPLVFLINEKWILPIVGTREKPDEKEADSMQEENPVIIAGFGHFGSTIGRLLRAHHINATVLDIDSDQVNWVRRMGLKVYYGDASRFDLLESAGAHKAKVIVIAIDNEEKRLEMIETIKKHFPNLRMFVRSANRYDSYDLMNAGMLHIYRETLDTSVRLATDVMKVLGYRAYHSERAGRKFLRYDEMKLKEMAAIKDEQEYVLTAKRNIEEIEAILRADMKAPDLAVDEGWDENSLIKEANLK